MAGNNGPFIGLLCTASDCGDITDAFEDYARRFGSAPPTVIVNAMTKDRLNGADWQEAEIVEDREVPDGHVWLPKEERK